MIIIEKLRKTRIARLAAYIIPVVFFLFLWTSCSEEQLFPGNARIKMAFQLTSPNALGGSITIQEAYLKLERITVTGRLGDQNAPEVNYPIPPEDPPYRLSQADTARISLTLPTRAYDQMDLHLLLLQTDYKLIVHQKTSEETPPPVSDGNDEPAGGVTDPNNGNDGGTTDGGDENDGEPDHDDDGRNEDDDDDEDGRDDDDDDDRDDENDRNDDDDGDDKNDDDDGDKKDKGNDDNDKKDKGDDVDDKKDKGDDDERDDDGDGDEGSDDDGYDGRTGGNELNGTVDLDHFFQHAKPSLIVFATWTFNGADINVVFAVTDLERIMIRGTQNGGPQIRVGEHGQGTASFDPERWFESISTTDLQNASLQTYQGQPVMFIHKDVNSALFETLLSNLTSSTTFEVAASPDQ